MSELDKIRKIIFEGDSALAASYKIKFTDVSYNTGKTFSSADFLKQASRPADRSENGDPLDDIVHGINPEDPDVIEILKSWKEEFDLEPWESIKETFNVKDGPEDVGVSAEEFHALVRQYVEAGFSEYMARHKAMQRLGQA